LPDKPEGLIEQKILTDIMVIRGSKVLLDSDLANPYGVETRRLNDQVRRNQDKFPEDFMFQLSKEEFKILKSQIETSSSNWGGRRTLPFAFTEHGALQAANVLHSEQANRMSVFIIRAFVKLREIALTNEVLSKKLKVLEDRVTEHDTILMSIIKEIRNLIDTPKQNERKRIGFRIPEKTEE
jgi:hypothetical protein